MVRLHHLLVGFVPVMLACIVSCSGSAGNASMTRSTTNPAASSSEEDEREGAKRAAALRHLMIRQQASCEQVGNMLFECAVEDARATMSPEDFAALDVTALEPQYKSEFMRECLASEMSLRQVEVYEDCAANTACAEFVPCLDQARPQQP